MIHAAAGVWISVLMNSSFDAIVLNRRVDLHAIDATPARWRGDVGPDTLVDFHTDDDGSPSAAGSSNNIEADASPNSSLKSSLAHTTQWTGCDGVLRIVQIG